MIRRITFLGAWRCKNSVDNFLDEISLFGYDSIHRKSNAFDCIMQLLRDISTHVTLHVFHV
jgi:methyl coenzyme M reductase alpha subunit